MRPLIASLLLFGTVFIIDPRWMVVSGVDPASGKNVPLKVASDGTVATSGGGGGGGGGATFTNDGSTAQLGRVRDTDSGAGTYYTPEAILVTPGVGGPVQAGTGSNPLRTDPTGTTAQPITASSLPLPAGAAQDRTAANAPFACRATDGANFYDSRQIRLLTSSDVVSINGTVPVSGTFWPTLAGAPGSLELSDGSGFYTAAKTGQLPAALVGGRLDVNIGAALPTGANTIGAVTQASGPWTANVTQWNGTTAVTGSGTATGALRVELANNGTGLVGLNAGSAIVGKFGIDQTTPGTTNAVQVTNAFALDNTLTGGSAVFQLKSGAKGSSAAALITSTISGANHQAADVAIYDASGNLLDPRARTWTTASGTDSMACVQSTAAALAGAWPVKVTDGTNTLPTGDAVARAIFQKLTDGTNTQAVKAASTPAAAADPSAVVAFSPNSPLPTGSNTIGALTANQSVNQTQLNGVAVSINVGSPDTGTQRVALAQAPTYQASTTVKTATAAGTGPFFTICGSATKTVRIQRFVVSGTVATAAVWGDVVLKKTSAATSGGTATALTKVPLDSNSAAATANAVTFYTVLATAGTLVGAIDSKTQLFPVTAISATLQPTPAPIEFIWRDTDSEAPTLRGTAQCMEANFGTTTTNAPTLTVAVKWTEL